MPGGRAATLTLGEWVAEYLDAHQGERDGREAPLAAREGDRRAHNVIASRLDAFETELEQAVRE